MRRVVAGVVACALLAGGVILLTGEDDGATYTITADVAQAPALFENGRVMVRGVKVGTITGVRPHPDGVRITMTIDSSVPVPAVARLSVVPITVIADRYVQLEPPYESGPTMADGAHIALADTTIPAELDDVLEQLKGLLAALEPRRDEPGPLAQLIDSLDVALAGRADELAGTLEGGAAVLGNLAANEAQIVNLITHLDRLFIALADSSSEIGIVNERLMVVTESLLADQDNLEGTIENIEFLSSQAANVIADSGADLGNAFGRLERVLNAVLAHEDSLAAGIRWSNVISQGLGATDASGRGLNAYTGRQAPDGSARAAYNYRIDTRDTLACERIGVLAERLQVINPSWGFDEVRHAVLSYIPEVYQDDLAYLIDLLIPLCADLPGEEGVAARARALVDAARAQMGSKRFARSVATALGEGAGR